MDNSQVLAEKAFYSYSFSFNKTHFSEKYLGLRKYLAAKRTVNFLSMRLF